MSRTCNTHMWWKGTKILTEKSGRNRQRGRRNYRWEECKTNLIGIRWSSPYYLPRRHRVGVEVIVLLLISYRNGEWEYILDLSGSGWSLLVTPVNMVRKFVFHQRYSSVIFSPGWLCLVFGYFRIVGVCCKMLLRGISVCEIFPLINTQKLKPVEEVQY
jgi:hypothetical protein